MVTNAGQPLNQEDCVMKLQEVVDALNVNVVDVQAWFADGYQHLTNAERRQPTVDQALFTVVIMGIGLLSFLDNR